MVKTYEYKTFGTISAETGTLENTYTYTGREYDAETGLYYYRARYYDSTLGRFINKDPIGIAGGLNQYAYVGNNPVNFVDPWGLLLTNKEIANIIFNETRSLSGEGIFEARQNIAHAIINGDIKLGAKRPKTAPTTAIVPATEQVIYYEIVSALGAARDAIAKGEDPTNGAIYFNFRNSNYRGPFLKTYPIETQVGPLLNSFPVKGGLNATGIYANTYKWVVCK